MRAFSFAAPSAQTKLQPGVKLWKVIPQNVLQTPLIGARGLNAEICQFVVLRFPHFQSFNMLLFMHKCIYEMMFRLK